MRKAFSQRGKADEKKPSLRGGKQMRKAFPQRGKADEKKPSLRGGKQMRKAFSLWEKVARSAG
ncbi:hypothetical protein [Butyrivibrio sp. WCD3002]|uniref:hypothetical protein n=1 Tax=Butyrivibrio sp. WCD3002 TaxID=1280676 RepID=UPI0004162400|nr:hypothetical protein [Butyrivibrio sp. WCD3002]